MSLPWLLVLAGITYASRAAALVLMPEPSPRLRALLERMPAPLFAGLAALSVIDAEGTLAGPHVFGAIVGALLTAPFRSLLLTLLGGLAGFGAVIGVQALLA